MDKYILQKDLPDSKAGDRYEYIERHGAYYLNGDPSSSYWMPNNVIDNPEWFLKEPELKWFVVPSEITGFSEVKGWATYKQRTGDMGGYANCKYFDTEIEAAEFVLLNKPVLSLQDIIDATISPLKDYANNPHFLSLKTLAQYKISQK